MKRLARDLGYPDDQAPHFPSAVVWSPQLARRICYLHRMMEKPQDALEAEHAFLDAVSELIAKHSDRNSCLGKVSQEDHKISRAKAYIQDHCSEKIMLRQLAGISGLSTYYFLRSFREMVGMPPHEYLRNVRVEKARTLLASGESIIDAACNTGFYDQSHLNRHFKRILGVTPGQYRAILSK